MVRDHELNPSIGQAQEALMIAMEAACRVDLRNADTGELIRVEEALQAASKAAKEFISLRLKQRSEREQAKPAIQRDAPVGKRMVADEMGTEWEVVAVYPSSRGVDQRTLPERFAQGWLLFQHGNEVRRHAPVPENWIVMSDADLRLLFQKADVPVRPRV